jgi:Protein of unknown function DUF262
VFRIRELQFHSVEWLWKNRDQIDESPDYQRRGNVWSQKDKAFLIDSILNGYDIPKMYLADFTSTKNPWNKRKKRYAVIDGKQRLEAITEFFDNELPLNKNIQYLADPSLELGGLTYKDLTSKYPELAQKFSEYELVIMGVITEEMGKINELFIRLNRSKPLVGAEIRNAMQGRVPPLIRKLATHKFFKTRIAFETGRQQDRNAAAKVLLLEFRGQFVDTKKAQLDGFVQEFIEEGIRAQLRSFKVTAQSCRRVLNDMTQVFIERDPLLRSQGPLTVYYWFIKKHGSSRKIIREFFVEFEEKRRENRKTASAQPPTGNIDTELLTFDYLSRSPNDQASCLRRYAILEARFKPFVESRSA